MNSESRENKDKPLDTSEQQPYQAKSDDTQSAHDISEPDETAKFTSREEINTSRSLTLERHEDMDSDKIRYLNSTLDDVRSIRDGEESEIADNAFAGCVPSFFDFVETYPLIWLPPAPADLEEDSVANNDDDDEYSDGTKWVQSNGFDIVHENSSREERQKEIMEAMNGQFEILVNKFLALENVQISEGSESWRNILAALSWEAASLIKPVANEGKAMDPGSYVKVKCIATGARSESEVIKGLVFKKNTAHKHVATTLENPRLLLLKGILGRRDDVGLSSFNSMEQENTYIKSIQGKIEMCHPNVVLVEKSVSRDMQEFLKEKKITLAFDMKLTRLNRISRCLDSPVISAADILPNQKVKQCDKFHIEKYEEELNNSTEGGKRSLKALMFLEGFPKPLGCTILLKGAHIHELKKVKRVVQFTVFAAYHLILESCFFADQRASFSSTQVVIEGNDSVEDRTMDSKICNGALDMNTSHIEDHTADTADADASDANSDGSVENSTLGSIYFSPTDSFNDYSRSPSFSPEIDSQENNLTQNDLFFDILNRNAYSDSLGPHDRPWQLVRSVSDSLKALLLEKKPDISNSFLSLFGYDNEIDDNHVEVLPVATSPATLEHGIEANGVLIQETPHNETHISEKDELSSTVKESTEQHGSDVSSMLETQKNQNTEDVTYPEGILVLRSSQCIRKGKEAVCENTHLSRMKYYGDADVSLGHFLHDLFYKKCSSSSCGEPPESHAYSYTHQNGNLALRVWGLPPESTLAGESEKKIWMWTRCLKCADENGTPAATHRVVMSRAARGLSFGKFLELSFSNHSVASTLSSKCGHSLHRDCLRFFGLGSKVVMFRYTPVEIYVACNLPTILDFYNLNAQEWIKREAKSVLQRGDTFFLEVANSLQMLKNRDASKSIKLPSTIRDVSEIEQLLIQDKLEFEASLLKAINFSGQLGKEVNGILSLSWLIQELSLELYIWDHRLHSLLQSRKDADVPHDQTHEQNFSDKVVLNSEVVDDYLSSEDPSCVCNGTLGSEMKPNSAETSEISITDSSLQPAIAGLHSSVIEVEHASSFSDQEFSAGETNSVAPTSEHQDVQVDDITRGLDEQVQLTEKENEEETKAENVNNGTENSTIEEQFSRLHIDDWIWMPSTELRKAYRNDLRGGSLQKFEFVNSYTPKYLSSMHQMISQEKDTLHFPVGMDDSVISVHEDEISSIIACALALSEDKHSPLDNGNLNNLRFDDYVASSFSSIGSFDSQSLRPSHSFSSLTSSEILTSTSDSSFFVDGKTFTSESLKNPHLEISVEVVKGAAKHKFSVICGYAEQFYSLRQKCCPSEMAYISSLSHCKKWDAQGGKSKAFFAKTLDDRFILKQVMKTEIDSFLEFAPVYFKHISDCITSGSQTCLAKILGIYQVRQNRGGKEVKMYLMVMENLLYGRNVVRTYDLKGALFSRYITDADEHDKVRLDENFIKDMLRTPMYISVRDKHHLERAIWNDTRFLTSVNVMDYSLLVGVDEHQHEFVFGIIDYLRQYTWDKQLETWVKSSLVVPKNSQPTVISPKDYKRRFRSFMSKYFMTVPGVRKT